MPKVALLPPKLPGNRTGTLGWNGDTHTDVIGHHMPLDNLTLFLARQRMEDRPQLLPDLPIQLPLPSFRYKDHMIFAIPARMRQALITVLHFVLLGLHHQATSG